LTKLLGIIYSGAIVFSRPKKSLTPAVSFRSIFNPFFPDRLPLHVGRNISTPAFERNNVIHNVALRPFGWPVCLMKSARAVALRLIRPCAFRGDFFERVELDLLFVVDDRREDF
jgi:hypothetical protein